MVRGRWIFICGIALIGILLIGGADRAFAVPRPEAINWRANPTGFITSLYQGVLGRNPESQQVVIGWARQVNNTPGSRLRVFWLFVGSQEYQNSRWSKLRREYTVYRKSQHNSRYWDYYAAKFSGGGHPLEGPYTFGVAMAIVGYHRAFNPTW